MRNSTARFRNNTEASLFFCFAFVCAKVGLMRLDQFIQKNYPEHSRAFWQKMIASHAVLVNGHPQKAHQEIKISDKLEIFWPNEKPVEKTLPDCPLEIIYEDLDLLVINKPAHLVVHPAHGHLTGTLIEQVAAHCGFVPEEFGDNIRPGLIHRLDQDTSGALVIAKNTLSQNHLARNLAERKFHKKYLALVVGRPKPLEGLIDAPLGRAHNDRRKVVISMDEGSKPAQTKYKVLESAPFEGTLISLVEIELLTGRTHQIRAHFVGIQHPVLGDTKYGNTHLNELAKEKLGLDRQALHAWKLGFPHPENDKMLNLVAPLPEDLKEAIKKLGMEFRA